jgi:hypothetical protein
VARGPRPDEFVERPERLGGVVSVLVRRGGGPADVEQVDGVEVEPVEALGGGAVDVVVREVRLVDLGGDEQLLPGHVGAGDPVADERLVPVPLCGVDVPVTEFGGSDDGRRTLLGVCVVHRPRAGDRELRWA